MTVEATHANEIVATFNKAVGSDAKVTLKKSTTDVANTAKIADDGKSATITLTGKLTEGTYTVTVVAGDETATADVVAKNEALSDFKIGTTVKEKVKADSTNGNKATAVLNYEALNQYGDRINYTPADGAVTVSIGKVDGITPCKTSGAGQITIKDIDSIYAIPGQSYTIVIVDTVNNTGTTLNTTAVYGASATATEFVAAGVYSVSKSAFKDIADGDVIGTQTTGADDRRFELLFTAKDQYGDDMKSADVAALASDGAISVTIAGGLTNIKAFELNKKSPYTREIGDTTYFAVPMTNAGTSLKANAGTYTVSIVNNTKGIVYTGEYTVTSGTIISSVDINQKDTIYADQENELDYTVVDTDGKEVTDYATLKDITIKGSAKVGSDTEETAFTWKKKADGSAKLVYKPIALATATTARDFTKSEVRACTLTANKAESGKYLVKSKTFTVYYQRNAVSVTGLASSATTVTTDGKLTVKLKDLVVLDQYQNPFSADTLDNSASTIGKDVIVSTNGGIGSCVVTANGIATGSKKIGTAGVTQGAVGAKVEISDLTSGSLKLDFVVSNSAAKITNAMKNGNGFTATFSAGDAQKVSGLYIASVNGGCPLYGDGLGKTAWIKGVGAANQWDASPNGSDGYIVVKGKVNGKDVVIEPTQYSIVGADASGWLGLDGVEWYQNAKKVITETREFSVVVSTADGAQTITGKVDVSNAPATAKTISAKTNPATSFTVASDDVRGITYDNDAKQVFPYASANALFTVKTQYNTVTSNCELVTYAVESAVVSGTGLKVDADEYGNGEKLPASVIKSYADGSNINFLYLDKNVELKSGAATGSTQLIVKATVEGTVAGTDSSATKGITITINF